MKLLIIFALLFSGCTMSFQPFPSFSKQELVAAFKGLQENDQILAKKLAELSAKQEQVK